MGTPESKEDGDTPNVVGAMIGGAILNARHDKNQVFPASAYMAAALQAAERGGYIISE